MNHESSRQQYRSLIRMKVIVLILLLAGTALFIVVNIGVGSSFLSVHEIIAVLFGAQGNGNSHMIITQVRLPMALMAVIVGASLGLGGCEVQTILKNPIASPYTLGISSAASFGAAVGLILEVSFTFVPSVLLVTANSFLFTLLAACVIYFFSLQQHLGKNAIVLFGVAMNFLFSSLTMMLQYVADEDQLQSLTFWSFGSLLKTDWNKLLSVTIAFVVCFFLLYRNSWKLTAMTLDDAKAQSLGVSVSKVRRSVIFLTSVLTAFAICFVGTIGFIGLIAPHIARLIVGEDQRFFMPISSLLGAFILSVAFLLSKLIIPGVILPIGLVTAFIGIPFFLFMIVGKKKVI